MTRIRFLHGAADRLVAACLWLHQEWDGQSPVLIYAPAPEVAERFDQLLWRQPAGGFLPHCRADSPLASETPILISDRCTPIGSVLINLSDEIPPGFASFEQLIEVVSQDEAVRLPARERFRFYRERGYALESRAVGQEIVP